MNDIFFDAHQNTGHEEDIFHDAEERQDIHFHNKIDYNKSTIRDLILHNSDLTEPTHEWGLCRNPMCMETLNKTFSLVCICDRVFYCSSKCMEEDTDHTQQCTHNNNPKYVDTCCECVMRISVGTCTITVRGDFDGVKKGKKFIRGTFSWKTSIPMTDDTFFIASYIGEMKTVKINGNIACIPHGKGCLKLCERTTIGEFSEGSSVGECDFYHFTDITYRAKVLKGVPVGIYEIFSGDTCMYVDESIWKIVRTLSVKCVLSGWKKSDHSMVLDIKNSMKPKIVEKKDVEKMCVRRVIYEERVNTIGFRCCVMGYEGGDEDVYVVTCATNGCFLHGTHHYSPACIKVGTLIDNDISTECSCQQKYTSVVDDSCIEVNSTKKVSRSKSRCVRSKKSEIKVKDRGVRGLSGRDMSKKDTRRFDSVDDALEDGGWELKRQSNHLVYKRVQNSKEQTFVTSKTPSCDIRRRVLSTLSTY